MTHVAMKPETPARLRGRAVMITEELRRLYGRRIHHPGGRPTDCLIGTILSQHTADRNSSAAFARLKDRFATWEEIAYADEVELAETIRCAGLANIKARRIQESLRAIESLRGSMDLDFLKRLSLDEARDWLRDLPGVGPKTAACVLLFSCDHPALPVDTHVHRLARRLGLIGPKVSADGAHTVLEQLVPREDAYDFHVNLITHGRQICLAREPRCGVCTLQRLCAFYSGEAAA